MYDEILFMNKYTLQFFDILYFSILIVSKFVSYKLLINYET